MDIFNHYLPWTKKRIANVEPSTWESLFANSKNVKQDQAQPISNLMVLLFSKLHPKVNLTSFKARARLVQWYTDYGKSIFNIAELETLLSNASSLASPSSLQPQGINLIGYSRGRFGLGEDIRAFSALLEQLGVNFVIYHIGHPTDDPVNYTHPNEGELTYDRSLFFLNAIELGKLVTLYDNFDKTFGRSIAVPPWELAKTPPEWASILAHFEQVWGISHFVTEALAQVHTNTHYSAPVVLPPASNKPAGKHPNNPFRFMFVFDAGSFIERKNPLAIVHAFQTAFSRHEAVELVIKVSNCSQSEHWQQVEQKAAADRRIKLVRGLITEAELNQLWDTADCYVSLHRSEGFGRTLAEAMLRRLPVIATNYSGSTDLFPPDYALLVDYTLVAIETGEYPFATDAKWASVHIEDAADKMRMVFESKHSSNLNQLTELAYQHVQQRFGLHNQLRPIQKWLL